MPSDILYPDISEASGLVMEEQERREEAERWRERGDAATEAATLPVKRSWVQPQTKLVTTTAILEGARNLSSSDMPKLNGVINSGDDGMTRYRDDQTDPEDKPPKLVVNLNQSDKASQIPEPVPAPEPDIESKKADEPDGNYEPDSCLVDCLYYSLQCCDCSIM